ncbi:MAG: nucleotidyl transferase AbiEii/AbiGii toxin family protein [Deltaproteobacteria bacterium]|nr:MAG: nucleotidyl transferase AbiEii/AbiGii toxin family protein [Deltaproteobacteria bacterium]
MIPKDFITSWRAEAPWKQDAQVEQDLVITRALVEMFRVEDIAQALAFRGGTALYKLHLRPAARYSEDIDLVQMKAGPIGETLDLVRSALDPWLGMPRRKFNEGRVNLVYRYESEDVPPLRMRLKVEINSREHFTEMGLLRTPVEIDNRWFTGEAEVTTFDVNELLGTKLRALYQRKKGRDLFDLWFALERGVVDTKSLLRCFDRYMAEGGHSVTRAQFEANLHEKSNDHDFRDDIVPLIRPGISWDFDEALALVNERIIESLPGSPWKGDGE